MMPLNWFMKKMKEVAEFILKEIDKQKMINDTKYVRKFNPKQYSNWIVLV
jgi:hypothetical protein